GDNERTNQRRNDGMGGVLLHRDRLHADPGVYRSGDLADRRGQGWVRAGFDLRVAASWIQALHFDAGRTPGIDEREFRIGQGAASLHLTGFRRAVRVSTDPRAGETETKSNETN